MADLLVRNVPASVLEALKKRAEERGWSLQKELLSILEEVAAQEIEPTWEQTMAAIRARLAATGLDFGDSAADIREDRD